MFWCLFPALRRNSGYKHQNIARVNAYKVWHSFDAPFLGDILLADVIENDSWRLWEDGDPNKMRDWQIYDTMFINNELTANNLEVVRKNCAWVAQKSKVRAYISKHIHLKSVM